MNQVLIMEPNHHHHTPVQEHGGAGGFHDANTGQWVDNSTPFQSHHHSPVNEYNGFGFNPMPMEPAMFMSTSMPPQQRNTPQQLQPLIMPPWPSMLTSQSNYATPVFQSAPIATTPITTPMSAPAATGRPQSTPRKTLTDADRRKMCQYAEANPTVKQTEIGGE
jgi:hypothetical protein